MSICLSLLETFDWALKIGQKLHISLFINDIIVGGGEGGRPQDDIIYEWPLNHQVMFFYGWN